MNDPVPVFIADYGIHSSVLMPQSDTVYVEYSFGDWAYAAENHDMPWNGVAALLFSFQSALGRTWTPMDPAVGAPTPVRVPNRIVRVYVERDRAQRVVAAMEKRYQNGKTASSYNVENDGYFIKDREHYALFNNCNHLSIWILREMGCKVGGLTVVSNFSMNEAKE